MLDGTVHTVINNNDWKTNDEHDIRDVVSVILQMDEHTKSWRRIAKESNIL